jgi:hypothetical protein
MRLVKMHTFALAQAFLSTLEVCLPGDESSNEHLILVTAFQNYKVSGYYLRSNETGRVCTVFGNQTMSDTLGVTYGHCENYDDSGHIKQGHDDIVTSRNFQIEDMVAASEDVISWLDGGV